MIESYISQFNKILFEYFDDVVHDNSPKYFLLISKSLKIRDSGFRRPYEKHSECIDRGLEPNVQDKHCKNGQELEVNVFQLLNPAK